MDALFFSDAVYKSTTDAVIADLQMKIGKVEPLMDFGFDEEGKQAIFVARSLSGQIIVSCRGTAGLRDVFQDLKYLPTRLPFAKGAAHWGFAERAQSVPAELFCQLLRDGEDVVFTGHSLGGAVASLLTLRVLALTDNLYEQHVQCITFGSPLFANWGLADYINRMYKDLFVHIILEKDFVPRILPFFTTVQKLLYASEDHMEGLWILRKALECLYWLPLGAFIGNLERNIPSPIKFVLRCVMKLAAPSGLTGSYAFAGHVWILDAGLEVGNALTSACTDDLNMWHSQLNFGLGVKLTASMLENHAMSSYYESVVLVLSQMLLLNDTEECLDQAPSFSLANSKFHRGHSQGSIIDSLNSAKCFDLWERACKSPSFAGHGTMTGPSVECLSFNLDCSRENKPRVQTSHLHRCHCYSSFELEAVNKGSKLVPDHSSCAALLTCANDLRKSTVLLRSCKAQSAQMLACTGRALMKHLGCCATVLKLFVPFSWDRLSTGARLQEVQTVYVASKMVSKSFRENSCSQSVLNKLHEWNHFLKPGANFPEFETEPIVSGVRCLPSSVHATCEMSKVLIKQPSEPVSRRGFKIGWFIGTIGRLARHLRVLDNLCILTFVRIFLSNVLV